MLVYMTQTVDGYAAGTTQNLVESVARGYITKGQAQLTESDWVNAKAQGKVWAIDSPALGQTTGATPFMWSNALTTSATGASAALTYGYPNSTIAVTAGAGVTNSLVRVEASNDGATYVGVATISLTAPGSASCPIALPYPFMRANVLAIAGGSVSASISAHSTPLALPNTANVIANPTFTGIPMPSTLILAQSAIPCVSPSSGSVAANGALSGLVALPATYSDGCWMYLPAGAAFAASAAGWYWVVMSSGTAGTIYNTVLPTGTAPYMVTAPTPIVAAGPGAFTGVSPPGNYVGITLPGNSMGPNGQLQISCSWLCVNNASIKTVAVGFGGTQVSNITITSQRFGAQEFTVRNIGVAGKQSFAPIASSGFAEWRLDGGAGAISSAIDTTQNVTITFIPFYSTPATDYVILAGFSVLLLPGA